MTGLKSLNIMAFHGATLKPEATWPKSLLSEIVERVPEECIIAFGPVTDEQRAHLASYVDSLHGWSRGQIIVVEKAVLEKALNGLECSKGSKSGSEVDYRWKQCSIYAL